MTDGGLDDIVLSQQRTDGSRFGGGLDYHITHKIVAAVEGGYNLGIGTQVEDYGYAVITGGVIFRF